MIKTFQRYFKLYLTLVRINAINLLIYRGNFLTSAFTSTLWGAVTIFTVYLLTFRTRTIAGWSKEELILIASLYSVVIGLFHAVFARNIERFSRLMHQGELDILLLKPASSQFLSSFWLIHIPTLSRVIGGILFTWYLLWLFKFPVTLVSIIGFLVLMVFSVLLLYSVWFLVITITVWLTHLSNLHELLYVATSIGRFPKEIYQGIKIYFYIFLLPLTLVVATPTKALIQKALVGDVFLLLVLSIGLFAASRVFWRFALRFYTSAGG